MDTKTPNVYKTESDGTHSAAIGEELLRGILESTADGILAVNSEGKATHRNRRFAELWRIPKELLETDDDNKLIGFVLEQLIDPEAFVSKVKELYNSSAESFDMLEFKDGRVFERFSCPLINDGEISGRVWSFRDVTEHRRVIEKLRTQGARLAEAQQVAHMGSWEYLVQTDELTWSQELGRVFGLAPNTPFGNLRTYITAVHPEDRSRVLRESVMKLRQGCPMDLVYRVMKANGQVRFVHQKGVVSKDKAGIVERVYGTIHDITERHRMDEARRLVSLISEEAAEGDLETLLSKICTRLGDIIDTTNFYVALYDSVKNTYSFPFSKDLYDSTDFAPAQLRRSLTDYVRRTGQPMLVDEAVHHRLKEEGEIDLIGHPSPIWLGVPVRGSGKTRGVMVVQHYSEPGRYGQEDLELLVYISESVGRVIERNFAAGQNQELRRKLERAQRMESLGILAGGVAHDLNNMLGPLVGYPELVLRKLPDDSPVRKQIERIGRAAKDAADVIQDLLTLARRGRFETTVTHVNDVIDQYLDSPSYRKLAATRPDVEVHLNFDQGIECIIGSAPHLSKVFMNLIVNAFDAMPNGGHLTIETSQKYLKNLLGGHDKIPPQQYIIMRVRDTGTGIAEEDLGRIFEPYYSKKHMGSSGSGLGLAIVYGIVKDHKGYYDVFSKVGEGTEFVLYFPVAPEEALKPVVDVKSSINGDESILIVDDSDEQRDLADVLLSNLGYDVTTVENGRAAVEYLKTHHAELVVMDMIMEAGFDGLDTYREIIKSKPGQKAVIVSGYSATERVVAMQELGAGGYVRKPYTQTDLGRAVRDELDRVISKSTV